MKVSIFGLGYVGVVTAGCMARDGHTVIGVDTDTRKLDFIRAGKAPIMEEGLEDLVAEAISSGRLTVTEDCSDAIRETDISLVCVGTPSTPRGSLDTKYVRKVCEEIGSAIKAKGSKHTVIIRSTVVPGTTMDMVLKILEREAGPLGEAFELAMNPEFLREGTSIKDFYDPPYTVVGTDSEEAFTQICGLYDKSSGERIKCSIPAAESIKYACNLYHATKITFANEIGAMCRGANVDSREVMEIVCKDTKLNISARYLRPGFAFGGSCLPKDMRAWVDLGRMNDASLPMFNAILDSNRQQIENAAKRIMRSGKRKVTIMGVSFKEGTDDLRESPMVSLAEILIGKGYEVAVFDPNVEFASLYGSNKQFIEERMPHLRRSLVSSEVAIRHGEVLVFGQSAQVYKELLPAVGEDQIVFDLAGVCGPDDVKGAYEGLYW